jgi:deoxyribonuclease-4
LSKQSWIGAHTSAAGGVHNALYHGQRIGASTIQLFTSNQRQWNSHSFTKEEIALWEKALAETGISQIMSHDSYLINLGSPVAETLEKSLAAFRKEIERCHALKIPYLNFHPGSATGSSEEQCIQTIIASLLEMEPFVNSGPTRLLIEATAGQGTQVGHRFEHLAAILDGVHKKMPVGVCIDTCHIFAAGYDLRTEADVLKTLKEFDDVVGLQHLYAFHLNDSLKKLGSRVDRHASIGKGEIGLECFRTLMSSHNTRDLPKYLETPDDEIWKDEILLLRSYAAQKD